jgi:transformer-2 protein
MSDNAPNQGNNLYIGNISSKTKPEDLKKLFSKYGEVTNCQIMFDPHTNKFRGFGFIAFEENSSADKAREQLQGFELDGKKITIEKAKRGRPRTPTPGRYHGAKARRPARFMRPQRDRYDPRIDRYDPREPRYDRRDYGRGYDRGYQDRFYDRPYDRGYQDRGYDRYDRYDRGYDRGYDRYERDRRPRYHYSSGRRSPV